MYRIVPVQKCMEVQLPRTKMIVTGTKHVVVTSKYYGLVGFPEAIGAVFPKQRFSTA